MVHSVQTNATEIIYHAASRVVKNNHVEFDERLGPCTYGNIKYIQKKTRLLQFLDFVYRK